ncbi:MAG: hypothetical protein HY800_06625 [Ignavibacteriales bacterium]|nr:hypothetical protein [Ignavibacteriales bacterium]
MCENITAGVIANTIFFVLTVLVGWSAFLLFRRRKLLKFFGIREQKRITVYLSNIRVTQGGSLGTDGRPRAYSGTTVTVGESLQGNLFMNLFSYLAPGLSSQPGILKYLSVSDVEVVVAPSPLREDDIDKTSTIVTLGSPGYNIVSEWVQRSLNPRMRFTNDNSAITVNGLPNITDGRQSFVQRIYDADNKRWVFYTAGLSELGTIGAAYFLVSRWRFLSKKYTTDKFEHVISVNPQNYQQSTIVI